MTFNWALQAKKAFQLVDPDQKRREPNTDSYIAIKGGQPRNV